MGLGPRRELLIECSGLGGAPIFDSIQGDLFLKCMSSTPVYGPSLAHLDVYADDQRYRHSTSIGRMTSTCYTLQHGLPEFRHGPESSA